MAHPSTTTWWAQRARTWRSCARRKRRNRIRASRSRSNGRAARSPARAVAAASGSSRAERSSTSRLGICGAGPKVAQRECRPRRHTGCGTTSWPSITAPRARRSTPASRGPVHHHRTGDVVGRAARGPAGAGTTSAPGRRRDAAGRSRSTDGMSASAVGRGAGLQPAGQGRRRGRLEHGPERYLDAQGVAQPRGQLGGEERVAAEREEVLLGPDPAHAQDAGHEARHPLHDGRGRRRGRRRGAPAACQHLELARQVPRPAQAALHLPGRGAWDAAGWHQHHLVHRHLVGLADGAAHRRHHLLGGIRRGSATSRTTTSRSSPPTSTEKAAPPRGRRPGCASVAVTSISSG